MRKDEAKRVHMLLAMAGNTRAGTANDSFNHEFDASLHPLLADEAIVVTDFEKWRMAINEIDGDRCSQEQWQPPHNNHSIEIWRGRIGSFTAAK